MYFFIAYFLLLLSITYLKNMEERRMYLGVWLRPEKACTLFFVTLHRKHSSLPNLVNHEFRGWAVQLLLFCYMIISQKSPVFPFWASVQHIKEEHMCKHIQTYASCYIHTRVHMHNTHKCVHMYVYKSMATLKSKNGFLKQRISLGSLSLSTACNSMLTAVDADGFVPQERELL